MQILQAHHFRLLVCRSVLDLFDKKVLRQIVLEEEDSEEEDSDCEDESSDEGFAHGHGNGNGGSDASSESESEAEAEPIRPANGMAASRGARKEVRKTF